MKECFMTSYNTLLPKTQLLRDSSQMVTGTFTSAAGVYSDVHRGHGFGSHDVEGKRVLEFAIANSLRASKIWFKNKDSHFTTCNSNDHSTQLDYILYHKSFSSTVCNVKAITNEEYIKQHHMVVCNFIAHIPHVKKRKFLPHINTCELRDPTTSSQFQSALKLKVNAAAAAADTASGVADDTANRIETVWSMLKDPLLVWMLPPNSAVSTRTTSGNRKPGGGMNR